LFNESERAAYRIHYSTLADLLKKDAVVAIASTDKGNKAALIGIFFFVDIAMPFSSWRHLQSNLVGYMPQAILYLYLRILPDDDMVVIIE
jgi:hypothetical protein